MPSRHPPRQAAKSIWLPIIAAWLLGLAGYFAPWMPHRAAGLVVNGLDLGEYIKFIPQVISGQMAVRREIFYLPLFAGSLTASLLASRRSLPQWVRILLGLGAILLALALLPPAWTPVTLQLPEFRLQTAGLIFCLAMAPAVILTRYLPDRLVLGSIGLLAIPAAILPTWAFLEVRPAIASLYRQPLGLGWGFWAELIGFLLVAFWAIAQALSRPTPRRD